MISGQVAKGRVLGLERSPHSLRQQRLQAKAEPQQVLAPWVLIEEDRSRA
jgi:hypothetical protein